MGFSERFDFWNRTVNTALEVYIKEWQGPGSDILKAMKYSLMAGGKRLRPILALAVNDMLSADESELMPYACAIEMIHTYSLIHDDLPAMDNDDYRRGNPTSHKVFGEAMAILAGDALLNAAFELMLSSAVQRGSNIQSKLEAMEIIARSAGVEGMIRGQVIDMQSEGKLISIDTLERMHRYKTGALITAPVVAAAKLAGVREDEFDQLRLYGDKIGLAFQIKDDILDVEGDLKSMGKAAGSDAAARKSTYVSIYGIDQAKKMLNETVRSAEEALHCFGEKAWFLQELARFIRDRQI